MKRFLFFLLTLVSLFLTACQGGILPTTSSTTEETPMSATHETEAGTATQTKPETLPATQPATEPQTQPETAPGTEPEPTPVLPTYPDVNTLPGMADRDQIMGTYATGNGSETVYKQITEDQLRGFDQQMKMRGFTLYTENEISGTNAAGNGTVRNLFYTYVSDSLVVRVGYHSYDGRCYVIREVKESATLPPISAPIHQTVCDTLITQIGSEDITLITDPEADFEQENDLCYVIRLADGSFFLIDSAETQTASRIYQVLKKQAPDPNNIVISGWVITHPHVDHYRGLLEFSKLYRDDPTITVKEFLYNFSATSAVPSATNREQNLVTTTIRSAFPNAKHSRPHTGDVFYFGNAAITFYYTQEDYLAANQGKIANVNGSSLVFRIVFDGKTSFFVPADHPVDGNSSSGTWCEGALENWYGKTLKSDISSVFHHGFGGGANSTIYKSIAPSIVLWDADWNRIHLHDRCAYTPNRYFCVKESSGWKPASWCYVAGENITVFNVTGGKKLCEYNGKATDYLA